MDVPGHQHTGGAPAIAKFHAALTLTVASFCYPFDHAAQIRFDPMTPTDPIAASLTEHEDFIRRTLRGLLRDENEVHDVVQETWIRALGAKGKGVVSGPWLARTARNIAVSRWRSSKRRERRERSVARAESARPGSTLLSLQRVEDRTRIAQTVVSLASPYRDVVLMKYEQELSVGEIAQRLGTAESTVRSQLSRAHALLRTRLDSEFGERRAWAILVATKVGATEVAIKAPQTVAVGLSFAALACVSISVGAWALTSSGDLQAGRSFDEATLGALGAASPLAAKPSPALAAPKRTGLQDDGRAAAAGQVMHLDLAPVTLLDRGYYDSYELSTYSLLRGTRDDPDRALTSNDWDLQLSAGRFHVNMIVDDRSWILDLTAIEPHEIGMALDWELGPAGGQADVHLDHTYVILTRDQDSALATVLQVNEFVPGRKCTFDWLTTDGTGRTKGSIKNEHVYGQTLSQVLTEYRLLSASRAKPLTDPRVRLQVVSGAVGGHDATLTLNGERSRILRETSSTPLDIDGEIDMATRPIAFHEGCVLDPGRKFIVTSATYRGSARGDSNGGGAFKFVLGGTVIAEHQSTEEKIAGTWTGEIAIGAGEEVETYLEVSNSSAGEVVLEGHFEEIDGGPLEGRPWAENEGFFVDVTAQVAEELARRYVPVTGKALKLQVRAGAGGGNPNRIDMRGRTSGYVDHMRDGPLDFSEEVNMRTPSEAFFVGGAVPLDKVFVVTSVEYTATAKGDGNGSGYVKLVVGGRTVLDLATGAEPAEGVWQGRLILRPDEETRTYLEVGNSSTADIVLRGRLQ